MKSIKAFIIKYVCLKILLANINEPYMLPSENKLAQKFNCTRLTSRSALILLESMGILSSHRGSRYLVTNQATRILMFPRFIDQKFLLKLKTNSNPKTNLFEEIGKCYEIDEDFYFESEIVATVSWKISEFFFHKLVFEYENCQNVSKTIIAIGDFGDKIVETMCFENNKPYLKQRVFSSENVFLFESLSWLEEISVFSKRDLIIQK